MRDLDARAAGLGTLHAEIGSVIDQAAGTG
jgi:hypothetical protein